MESVIGCVLCFLCGMVCTLAVQVLDVKNKNVSTKGSNEIPKEEIARRDERLREQWENFLNYNGHEQTGGDE